MYNKIIADYSSGMSFKDICDKHNISTTSFYRLLKKLNIKTKRQLTDFGDVELFKQRYITLPKQELELLYNTSYNNIKNKAAGLGIKRPRTLIKYKESTIKLSEDMITNLYNKEKLSSHEIAVRCGITSE